MIVLGLKVIIAIGSLIMFFILMSEVLKCCEFEEWKKHYIPVSNECDEVLNRMRYLYNLPKPTANDLYEFTILKEKANALLARLNAMQERNPRRKRK